MLLDLPFKMVVDTLTASQYRTYCSTFQGQTFYWLGAYLNYQYFLEHLLPLLSEHLVFPFSNGEGLAFNRVSLQHSSFS